MKARGKFSPGQGRFGQKGSGQMTLTSLEFAVLEFLMDRQGKALSGVRILRHVWCAHEDRLTHFVDVSIRRVQAEYGPETVMATIRGRGCRLEAGT